MAIRIIWFNPRCTSHILPLNLRKPLKSYSVCLIALFERNGTPSDYWHSCGLHFVKILSLNIYNKIKPETTNIKVEILVRHGTSLHAGFFFFTDTPCNIRKKKSDAHKLSCFIFFNYYYFFYCSGFCHTLKWNSHGFTCVPHPDPPSHLPLHLIPLGLPSAPGPSACLMHPTWAGDLFHPR